VHIRSRKEEEEEMLTVWYWDKVMRLIHAGDLINHIQSLQLTLLGKKVTLVIYGAEEYFRSELNSHSHTGMQLMHLFIILQRDFW
jgi:predicted phosphodiesterase